MCKSLLVAKAARQVQFVRKYQNIMTKYIMIKYLKYIVKIQLGKWQDAWVIPG